MMMSLFSTELTSSAKAVEAFNFNDFEAEGEQILAKAHAEAKAIKESIEAEKQAAIKTAKEEAKKEAYAIGFKEGKNEGYKVGLKQGTDETTAKLSPSLKTFDNVTQQLETKINKLVQEAQNDFIELVKVIALKVIHKHLNGDDTIIANAMEHISEFIVQKNSLIINLNPDDKAMATQWLRNNKARFDKLKSLKINSDESISRGSCKITTPEGGINLNIEEAITAIVEEL